MLAPSHLLLGAATYASLPIVGVDAPLEYLGWAAISALAPDIDHPSSWVSQVTMFFGKFFRWVTNAKHRQMTHQWWFACLVTVIVAFFWPLKALAVFTGWGSHIIGDHIHKTGGKLERWVIRPALCFTLPVVIVLSYVVEYRVVVA